MVHLLNFQKKYAADGLFVYAIAMLDERDKAQELTRQMGITYPVFWGVGSTLGDRYAYG